MQPTIKLSDLTADKVQFQNVALHLLGAFGVKSLRCKSLTIERTAQARIQKWAYEAAEFAIGGNFTLSGFVASHRRACVWAVLIGREAAGEALRPAPVEEQ